MFLGFVLLKYGKRHRHGNDFHEGISSYSQIPRIRMHSTSCRATWGSTRVSQEAKRVRGKCKQEPLLWFL